MSDHFVLGKWKAVCDRCGFDYKNTDLRLEWTNLRVCHGPGTNDCWQARNTQEHVKGVVDRQAPPWVRPQPPEIELSPGDVTQDDL